MIKITVEYLIEFCDINRQHAELYLKDRELEDINMSDIAVLRCVRRLSERFSEDENDIINSLRDNDDMFSVYHNYDSTFELLFDEFCEEYRIHGLTKDALESSIDRNKFKEQFDVHDSYLIIERYIFRYDK